MAGALIGSFSIRDGNVNDDVTNEFDLLNCKYKRAARTARTLEQLRAVFCKTTT